MSQALNADSAHCRTCICDWVWVEKARLANNPGHSTSSNTPRTHTLDVKSIAIVTMLHLDWTGTQTNLYYDAPVPVLTLEASREAVNKGL